MNEKWTILQSRIKCWYVWYCFLKVLYLNRSKVLTFKTPQTESIVTKLSSKSINDWTLDDYTQLISMYLSNTKKTIQAEYMFDETYTRPKSKISRNKSMRSISKKIAIEAYFDKDSGRYLIKNNSWQSMNV